MATLSKERPCSLVRRLLAMMYDAVIVVGLLFIAAAVALPVTRGELIAFRDPLYTFYLLLTWFAYLGWCWTHGGMSLGMRAWRVSLVREGGPMNWRTSALRFSVSLVSAAAFGIGFAWCQFDPYRRAWHDLASRTRLVWNP